MAAPSPQSSPSRWDAYRPAFDRLFFILALVGVLVTVHLVIQQGRGFDRGCLGFSGPSAAAADCNLVTQSGASTLLGVSNAVWGVLFYLVVAALSAGVLFLKGSRRALFKQVRAALVTLGFAYSVYLVLYQVFSIGEYCVLCLTSAAVVTALFITQAVALSRPAAADAFAMKSKPWMQEAKLFGGLAALLVVLLGADFVYFNGLEQAQGTPAQPVAAEVAADTSGGTVPAAACQFSSAFPPVANPASLVGMNDPVAGNLEASVTVVEFFDPNCPHCKSFHPVLKEVLAKNADKARFVFKPIPLWAYSVPQVEALFMAAQERKFFELLDKMYAVQEQSASNGLSPDQIAALANEVGMNGEAVRARLGNAVFRNMAMQQRDKAAEIGLRGVPALLINGRLVEGEARTVECLSRLIEEAAS